MASLGSGLSASQTHRKGQVEGRTLSTTWSLMCEITSAQQGLLLRYKGCRDLYWFAEQVTSEIGMASICPHIFERLASKAVAPLLSCYKNSDIYSTQKETEEERHPTSLQAKKCSQFHICVLKYLQSHLESEAGYVFSSPFLHLSMWKVWCCDALSEG